MSLMQEMEEVREIIGKERSALLEEYCLTTGADMGKVIYTLKGWDEFINWIKETKIR